MCAKPTVVLCKDTTSRATSPYTSCLLDLFEGDAIFGSTFAVPRFGGDLRGGASSRILADLRSATNVFTALAPDAGMNQ
jgi:hypothetical protein